MGGRQSKRSGSVDITGTPKKGEVENGAAVEGGRLEKIEEGDLLPGKVAANGTTPHLETQLESPLLNGETTESPERKVESEPEEPKTPDTPATTEAAEPETPDDRSTEEAAASSTPATEPETKQETGSPDKTKENEKSDKKKNKEKTKKKWSFRSISFSKKDKSKPTNVSREESKNGNLAEQGGILQEVSESVEQAVEQAAAVTTTAVEEVEKKVEETVTQIEETVKNVEDTVTKAIDKVKTEKEELTEQVAAATEDQKEEIVKEIKKEESVIVSAVSSVLSNVSSTVESTATSVFESTPSVDSSAIEEKKSVLETPPAAPFEEVKPAPIDTSLAASVEEPLATELIKQNTPSPIKLEPESEESKAPVPEAVPVTQPEPVPAKLVQSEPLVTEVVQPEPIADEVPPPLPASPPPTEAPPPTPVQPTSAPEVPAPENIIELEQTLVAAPIVNDLVKEDISVCDEVGGGGESMAELGIEDSEVIPPPVDVDDKVSIPDLPPPPPMVNGISNDDAAHNVVEKIDVKTLPLDNTEVIEVSDAIVSTVTHTTNSIEE